MNRPVAAHVQAILDSLAQLQKSVKQRARSVEMGGQCKGRGPDKGIDGEISFVLAPGEYGLAIVSVKGGRHVGPDAVRVLKSVVRREGADMGVFVCLNDPTADMRSEAASGGRIELPGGERARIQIVTARDLIAGPNLGILTELNTVRSNREARVVQRAKGRAKPARDLNQLPLPPMAIKGGKTERRLPVPEDAALAQAAERTTPFRRRR